MAYQGSTRHAVKTVESQDAIEAAREQMLAVGGQRIGTMAVTGGAAAFDCAQECMATVHVEAVRIMIGSALFRCQRHPAHLGLRPQGGAGRETSWQTDEAPEIKLLFERTAIMIGGVAGCVSPADRLAIRGKANRRDTAPLARQAGEHLTRVYIPEQYGLVITAPTRDPLSTGMKGSSEDQIIMAGEGPLYLPCGIGQEGNLARPWGRLIANQEPLSIGRKGQGRHFMGHLGEDALRLAIARPPQANRLIGAPGGQHAAIGMKGDAVHLIGVVTQASEAGNAALVELRGVPQAHSVVIRGHGQPVTRGGLGEVVEMVRVPGQDHRRSR